MNTYNIRMKSHLRIEKIAPFGWINDIATTIVVVVVVGHWCLFTSWAIVNLLSKNNLTTIINILCVAPHRMSCMH